MPYRPATARSDHRDLASGFVLRSAPGYPAFPVRLAQELFLRAAAYLPVRVGHRAAFLGRIRDLRAAW